MCLRSLEDCEPYRVAYVNPAFCSSGFAYSSLTVLHAFLGLKPSSKSVLLFFKIYISE